jgi:hypothetical protein
MTVQQLRNNGYKVRVLHNRLYNGRFKWQNRQLVFESPNRVMYRVDGSIEPDTKGGSTHIIIDSPSGDHYEGVALCSIKDNYNKKLGVRIALGRCNIKQQAYIPVEVEND